MKEATEQGVGIDAFGGKTIDPTANVIALVSANKEHADELRALQSLYIQAQIATLSEVVKRVEDTSELNAKHTREVSSIHQVHDAAIHKMEQEKLAAFRASDEMARLTEANRSLEAIKVVERTLSSTATALASQNAENNLEVNRRLAALEKSSYEGAGKQAVADPMLVEMREDQKRLIAALTNIGGEKSGRASQQQMITWVLMTIVALIAIAAFVGPLIKRG